MLDLTGLKAAYENNPLGFVLLEVTPATGKATDLVLRYLNPAAARLLPPDSVQEDESCLRLLQGIDPVWFPRCCQAAREGTPQTLYFHAIALTQALRVDCFQCAPGFCGCLIQALDASAEAEIWASQTASLLQENRRLQHQDPLTGGLNFEGFKRRATQLIRQCQKRNYALYYCDIKRFKYLNDVFGYEAGDRLLRHWAEVIQAGLRDGELLGRISGDYFVVLAYYDDPVELEARFWLDARHVRSYFSQADHPFEIEICAGVYMVKPEEVKHPDVDQMLDWANVAQKSQKHLHGSHIAFFTEEMWQRQLRELEITQHMREGLAANEFFILLQPQYDYPTGMLVGAETLVRWNHPEMGLLSPDSFIPVLERSGQIYELDQHIWDMACRCMRRWLDSTDGLTAVPLSVNVSRAYLQDETLCSKLCQLLETYNLPAKMLRLEITESAYMEEPDQLISVAAKLRRLGFTVEMDDFGSGYSSLNILKDVPVDVLKLDMRFLSGGTNAFRGGSVLSSVVRMARWLELPVIAEGVETKEQADGLKSMGCDLMQGYFFARPMPVDEFEALLRSHPAENIRRQYRGVDSRGMREFLDSGSSTAFLFNHCIGAAALLEYNGENVEALMLNDAFYMVLGLDRKGWGVWRTHMLDALLPEDRDAFLRMLDLAVARGSCIQHIHMRLPAEHGDRYLRIRLQHLTTNSRDHVLFALLETADQSTLPAEGEEMTADDRLFAIYSQSMSALFTEVTDLDYERDTAVLIHSASPLPKGSTIQGLDGRLAAWPKQWGLNPEDSRRYLDFISPANLAECHRSGKAASLEVCTGKGSVYRGLLLPLTPARALVCAVDITKQKQAEELLVSSARYAATQDLFTNLPVGALMYTLNPEGKRKLKYVSAAASQILHRSPEVIAEKFEHSDFDHYLSFLQDPKELERMLRGPQPFQRRVVLSIDGQITSLDLVTNLIRREDGSVDAYSALIDASDRIRLEQLKEEQQTLYRILSELPQMMVFDYDPGEDRLEYYSNMAGVDSKFTVEKYLAQLPKRTLLSPESIAPIQNAFRKAVESAQTGTVDYQATYDDGARRWYRAHYASLADLGGNVYRLVGRVDNIDDEVRREHALWEKANRDAMTGFLNHDAVEDAIINALKLDGGTLFIVDIDDFKQINDALGHLLGDTFLRMAADAIRAQFRSDDILGRFGGDEFLIFSPGLCNLPTARHKAQAIVRAVAQVEVPELEEIHCSVGVAITNTGDITMAELFRQADFALYDAKGRGKGRYCLYQGGRNVPKLPPAVPRQATAVSDAHARVLAGDVFSILYHQEATADGINEALAHIGRWLDVSRVYIYENSADNSTFSNTFEWCSDGISSQIDNLQDVQIDQPDGNYYDCFNQNRILYCTDLQLLPSWIRDHLEVQGVRTTLQRAFQENGVIRGFIGFDECREHRLWTQAQVDCLVRTAEVVSMFLRRLRLDPEQ